MLSGNLVCKTQTRPLIWQQALLLAPDFERTGPNPNPDHSKARCSQSFLDAFGMTQPFIERGRQFVRIGEECQQRRIVAPAVPWQPNWNPRCHCLAGEPEDYATVHAQCAQNNVMRMSTPLLPVRPP